MNRVWKIIEERKGGMRESGMRGGYSSRRMGGMSGRKGSEYEDGVKDGMCAALDILEDHIKDLDKD